MQISYEENLQIETNIDKLKKDIGNTIIRSRYLYDSLFLLEEEIANREKAIIESNDNRNISFEISKLEKQIEKIIKEAEQILNVENIFTFNEIEKTIKEKLTSELSSYPDMDENTLEKTIVLVEKKIGDNLQQQKDIYEKIFHLEKKQLENNEKILAYENIIEENNKDVKIMNDSIKRLEKTNNILRKYK